MSSSDNASMEIILVRMEGKIDRMGDRMTRYEQDVTGIRQRLHDLSNEITPIVMLDLNARIRIADAHNASVDVRITALENIEQQRKGAAMAVKAVWALLTALGIGGAAAIVKLLQTGAI